MHVSLRQCQIGSTGRSTVFQNVYNGGGLVSEWIRSRSVSMSALEGGMEPVKTEGNSCLEVAPVEPMSELMAMPVEPVEGPWKHKLELSESDYQGSASDLFEGISVDTQSYPEVASKSE